MNKLINNPVAYLCMVGCGLLWCLLAVLALLGKVN